MLGPVEIALLASAAVLAMCAAVPNMLRAYRPLLWGSSILLLTAVPFPRPGNRIGEFLFDQTSGIGWHLPSELFGIAWWILGAWLAKSILDLILRRTIFPDDNQPHARRIYADLVSALMYLAALVGIVNTVLKQPLSAVLAASGVVAIVLGLALQNTLADVFAGLAINIEQPFGAGDWITVKDGIGGQVMEVNWRATRIRTLANDMAVIPNSIIARAIVTKHRRMNGHVCSVVIRIDHRFAPVRVMNILVAGASGITGLTQGTRPTVRAREFSDAFIVYELAFAVQDFVMAASLQSEVIAQVTELLRNERVLIGVAAGDLPLICEGHSGVISTPHQASQSSSAGRA